MLYLQKEMERISSRRQEAEEAAEQTEMLRGIRYWPEPMDRRSMPEQMHLSRLFQTEGTRAAGPDPSGGDAEYESQESRTGEHSLRNVRTVRTTRQSSEPSGRRENGKGGLSINIEGEPRNNEKGETAREALRHAAQTGTDDDRPALREERSVRYWKNSWRDSTPVYRTVTKSSFNLNTVYRFGKICIEFRQRPYAPASCFK